MREKEIIKLINTDCAPTLSIAAFSTFVKEGRHFPPNKRRLCKTYAPVSDASYALDRVEIIFAPAKSSQRHGSIRLLSRSEVESSVLAADSTRVLFLPVTRR